MKTFILSAMLCSAAIVVNAQTSIKANFNKGDSTIYQSAYNFKMDLPMGGGRKEASMDLTQRYVVLDKSNKGFKIESTFTNVDTKGDEMVMQQNGVQNFKYMLNQPIVFLTDANGKITKIENYDAVIETTSKHAIADLDEMYKKNPMLEQVMPKATAIMALGDQLSEENVISFITNNSIFSFYGKTIKTGDVETRTFQQGVKGKTTYTLTTTGNVTTLQGDSKGDMTENEVKQMIISNMQKMGMDAETAKSQIEMGWGQMKQMGMTNLYFTSKEIADYQPNGWVSTSSTNASVKLMGMDLKIDGEQKIVSKNW